MSKNTIAYETIANSKVDITGSSDQLQAKAREMTDAINEAIGQGGIAWQGESANIFADRWSTFAEEKFPEVKRQLENLVNVQLETWRAEFEAAEEKSAQESGNIWK